MKIKNFISLKLLFVVIVCALSSYVVFAQRKNRTPKMSFNICKEITETAPANGNTLVQVHKQGKYSGNSDVDTVPITDRKNEATIVVIIANENYQNDVNVDYALRDGSVFKEYCVKTLGVPENHIRLVNNATFNNIRASLSWIKSAALAMGENSRIIFYYSGHGLPDEETRSAYILPVDGDGRNPQTGYSLDALYKELALCKTVSSTVFIDACFSGARRDGGMIVSAKSVVISPKEHNPYGNLIVLSAAHGAQTAYKFDAEGHGLFTYYLLKSLKDTKGNVSLGELSEYLIRNVSQTSIFENDKIQTPTVLTGSTVATDWRTQKL